MYINRELQAENQRLKEENMQLKRAVVELHRQLYGDKPKRSAKQKSYIDKVKSGEVKPRLREEIDEKAIVKAIAKLGTADMNEIAKELDTSYSTIRRRLMEYELYPVNIEKIKLIYQIFYLADDI